MQRTILVIDDNQDIRENTAEILELAGYKTLTAENGRRGVEIALRQRPSLIICDIMMPELDGYGVLHLLRKSSDTELIPFIFLTAKSERSDLRKGMEMGADDYITKPFDDIELLNAVEVRLRKLDISAQAYGASVNGLRQFLADVGGAGIAGLSEYPVEVYSKKHSLYIENKRPRYLFYLVTGKVKAFRTHEDGKEYITNLYTAGDFIGYTALLNDTAYDDSATVMDESEIIQIPKDDFLKIVFSDPVISQKFIHLIAKNVKEKEERLLNLAYSSLRKRVAKALIDIAGKFNNTGGRPLEVSREEIAQYVGTATESLIRTLSDFKSEGLLEIKSGKIIMTTTDRLEHTLY